MAPTNGNDKIQVLLISEIEEDLNWNTRYKDEQSSGGPGEDTGEDGCTFDALVTSIETDGQDTPIIVRPNAEGKKKPFFLVAGFRRLSAIKKIAEKKGDKAPTVKAIVRNVDDVSALELNIRENTARDGLSGADLVFGVSRLLKMYKAANKKYTQAQMGDKFGVSQAYMSIVMKIAEFGRPEIVTMWRESPVKLSITEMHKVASEPHADQQAKYNELVRGKAEKDGAREEGEGKRSWTLTAKKTIETVGTMLGYLVRDGAITIDDEDNFFEECIDVLVKVNKKATKKELTSVAKVGKKAYLAAYETPVVEEGEEQEVTKPKGNGRAAASA